MSAYVVGQNHIDALVTFAVARSVSYWCPLSKTRVTISASNAEVVGQMLLDENVVSVCHRYGDAITPQEKNAAAAYRFRWWHEPLGVVQVLKAINCLSYQSCEHPGWEGSLPQRILREIKESAIRSLPGYEAADWEMERKGSVPVQDLPKMPPPKRPDPDLPLFKGNR